MLQHGQNFSTTSFAIQNKINVSPPTVKKVQANENFYDDRDIFEVDLSKSTPNQM